ncbi:MAG: flagellar filament capping protein FliD [Pseudomonadota bacterium]
MPVGVNNEYGHVSTDSTTGQAKVAAKINGLDINAVVDSIVSVKKEQSELYQDQIILNVDVKIPAIDDLRTKVETLDNSLKQLTNELRSNFFGNSDVPNALNAKLFRPKQADGAVELTISPVAKISTTDHKINVSQVAAADSFTSSFHFVSPNTPVTFSGNLVINNQTVAITENVSTLNTIINDINSLTESAHVSASLLEISKTSGYVLILESTELAEPINFMGAAGTDASLQGSEGLKLPTTNTDPSTIATSTDEIVSGYTTRTPTGALGFSGNLVINGQAIPITSTSTLNSIMNSINYVSDKSNVSASVTTADGTNFALTLTGTQIGVPINFLAVTTSASLQGTEGLQLPSSGTSPSLLVDSKDHIVSGYTTTDPSAPVTSFSGTLLINNQAINITTNSSLNSIRDAINALSKETHIIASVASTDGINYALVLDETRIGTPIDFLGATTDASLRGTQGLLLPITNTDIDSLLAKISINGTNIERSSNIISNAILGVKITVNAKSTLVNDVVQDTIFGIDYDKDKAFKAINELITNYNAVIDALAEQKKMQSDGKTPDPKSVLYGENIISQIQSLLQCVGNLATIGARGDDYTSLMDIGLELNARDSEAKTGTINGKIHLNSQKLKEIILDGDFRKIIKLFGNFAQSTNPDIQAYSMPTNLNSTIAGNPIKMTYTYIGALPTDELFATNFSVPQPTTPLGAQAAGQAVTLTYTQNADSTYSAVITSSDIKDAKGNIITDLGIITSNAILSNSDNTFTFPSNSIYAGLVVNFTNIESPPTPGSPIITTFTLPQFTATLSMTGQTDVFISNVQGNFIKAPEDSIYAGLKLGFVSTEDTSPVSLNQSVETTLILTQGIAINFNRALSAATAKYDKTKEDATPTSIFDIAIQDLLDTNKKNEKHVQEISDDADRIRQRFQPMLQSLYETTYRTQAIALMLETQLALLND